MTRIRTDRVEVLDLDLEPLVRVASGQPFITVRRVGLLVEATRWTDRKPSLTARRLSRFGALRAIRAITLKPWWVPGDSRYLIGVVQGPDGPGGQVEP